MATQDRLTVKDAGKEIFRVAPGVDIVQSLSDEVIRLNSENERLRDFINGNIMIMGDGGYMVNGKFLKNAAMLALNPNKHTLMLHGPITTTQGDIRDPSTWVTTEEQPPQKEMPEIGGANLTCNAKEAGGSGFPTKTLE